ncbi:DEAD/DEAH box helicase family protein [Glaciecola siphonariae]|uniref:DEAD/DEAH box helicase family protein n=1 Tax=Glaciecola siphonariae TaxID=521012 RepID=A0ABV9LSB1_9ALTE
MLNNTSHQISFGNEDPFLPHLLEAINRSARIDFAVSFIKMSGLQKILSALVDAGERGASIRILTSDYLNITEPSALGTLNSLTNIQTYLFAAREQSFHVKSYIFCYGDEHENLSDGIAFIGSSNLSKAALTNAFEWNVGVQREREPAMFSAIQAAFAKLLNHPYTSATNDIIIAQYAKRYEANRQLAATHVAEPSPQPAPEQVEEAFQPNMIQEEALQALAKTREDGYLRGLVVMATGTGKTWLAAFDAANIEAKRVLFIAHREEILLQAQATFGQLLPNYTSGIVNAQQKELKADLVFASVMTIGKGHILQRLPADHFDYVVIDEFHHASAPSYQAVMNYFTPRFLLGLTATPKRTDNANILALCDNNLVYQIDMPLAIAKSVLVPFRYYGIKDTVDYAEIPWRNGKFDPDALTSKFATRQRAQHNFVNWQARKQSRTLGFCVSIAHAEFMAEYFSSQGARALAVHSRSHTPRNVALQMLSRGEIDIIFAVDLFNEGTDLPLIDTILMLRPTESKIIYLQQIGRGLRLAHGKSHLVIIDYVGNHNTYFTQFEALLGINSSNEQRKAFLKNAHAITLDNGCFVNLAPDAVSMLDKLVQSSVKTHQALYQNLSETLGHRPTLSEYIEGGGDVSKIRHHSDFWFNFVYQQEGMPSEMEAVINEHGALLFEVEKTAMTKSFKMILLKAFIECGGLLGAVEISTLCERSWYVLRRHPELFNDLTKPLQRHITNGDYPASFTTYWNKNPINAWVGGNSKKRKAFFEVENDRFGLKKPVSKQQHDLLSSCLLELIDYKLMVYGLREGVVVG